MRTTNRYNQLLVGTCLRLFEQDGIRDPSIVEIALAVMHQPPPDNPIMWPDTVGGEIFQGVSKRLADVRGLLDAQGYQCAPVGLQYYARNMRGRVPEDYEVYACLPTGGPRQMYGGIPIDNRPYGIRFVIENEEDPIFIAHLDRTGVPAHIWAERVNQRLKLANEKGVVSKRHMLGLAGRTDGKLTLTPKDLIVIAKK